MENLYDVIIVGGGLSGLSTAHFLRKFSPHLRVVVLEQAARAGGAIRSLQEEGYLAEWGAHGFLDNAEASRELLSDTGLDQECQKAPLDKFVRYICLGGGLRLIPQNPKKIIASSLLPFAKKLRVLGELWKKPVTEEQTVSQWAAHRFGSAILPFVDAVFTGTYAGDIERLSIDAVMPGVRKLELQYGSVLKGLIQKKKQNKTKLSGLPSMVSFPTGMGRLPETLAQQTTIQHDITVKALQRAKIGWQVQTNSGAIVAETVVIATTINTCLALLKNFKPPQDSIAEARINNVVMGFSKEADIPFGFGYLAPEQEKRFALGALFSTHMFPGRAPEGRVMLEALVGGRRHPDRLELDDAQTIQRTYDDLKQLLHLPKAPCFTRVLRPQHGIPQLEIGYPDLLEWKNRIERENQGLHVNGFGWEGIGINDMTKAAKRVAEAIVKGMEQADATEVKGVYF